jgi:CubicO group peptidase (beta-lactamase class C family)
MQRRQVLGLGLTTAAAAVLGPLAISDLRAGDAGRYAPAFARLDAFVEQYLRDLNAPAMTLALADANGLVRVADYGFDNPALGTRLATGRLFHIGSISKSFTALCVLQLVDEGKLDLHRPIKGYLPWLRFEAATRELTAHDLLTHGAALPDGALFPADPAFRHRPTAAPGSFFHYCNMGYEALGHLVATLDDRPLAESLRARVIAPLGMSETAPVITFDIVDRLASSYLLPLGDRPAPHGARLAAALPIVMTEGSGCVASTARDMGAYLTMLVNGGHAGNARVASEAGFALFATPHIKADEFGKDASYGYGIAVDTLDGHRRLRHTGGMVSFASALEVDRDSGVGVFASVNAMQGVRPRPVAEYALRLMRACREGASLPPVPAARDAAEVAAAADYAGRYLAPDGRALEVVADGARLYLVVRGARVVLEPLAGPADAFAVRHPDYAHFPLAFGREHADGTGPVVEAGFGGDWYAHARYSGPREFAVPAEWHGYVGHYRDENPWIGSLTVVLRRGRLWLGGVVPLEPAAGGRFYLRDDPDSPEWVEFADLARGRAMRIVLSGASLVRV